MLSCYNLPVSVCANVQVLKATPSDLREHTIEDLRVFFAKFLTFITGLANENENVNDKTTSGVKTVL